MSSFCIESESVGHLEPLQLRDSILVGRGPVLKVTDKSVSRNHAKLVLDSAKNKLSIKSVHTNPTFVHKVRSDKTVVLNKGEEIELCDGDRFSFLPDKLFFRVTHSLSSTDQTLHLPVDNDEITPTPEIDLDPLESFKSPVDTSDTLFIHTSSVELNSDKDPDPLETVRYPIDNSDTLYLPEATLDINATQIIDADPLETLKIPTDMSQTLYLPTGSVELNDIQDIDLDPLETFKSPIDYSATLYLPTGTNEFNSTQEIDTDPLETYKEPIENSDTLYIPAGSDEFNSTQEIEADPLETVKIPTDNAETLCIPADTVEMNSTQEIEPDYMETLKIPTDNPDTLSVPAGDNDEFTSTQDIDSDPLEISKKTMDTAGTLLAPAVNSAGSNGTGEIEKHEIVPIKESVMENNSCSSDSAMAPGDGESVSSSSQKKRKLPVWMLEDPSATPSNKKVKSKTDTKISKKLSTPSKQIIPPPTSSTSVIVSNDASIADEVSLVSRDTISKPAITLESKECPITPHSSSLPEPTCSKPDTTDIVTDDKADILPVCPYGADCYRKNPDHHASYSHPTSSDKAVSTSTKICPYGSECYRKNPAHFKEFSHPKASSSRAKKPRAAKTKKTSVLDGASDDDGTTNSYNLKDDFIDDSGNSSESCSTEIESSDSEEWQPNQDVNELLAEADEFVKNPKMLRK